MVFALVVCSSFFSVVDVKAHYNQYHPTWPIGPDKAFVFLDLDDIRKELWHGTSWGNLYGVIIGGSDHMTQGLQSMRGLYFDSGLSPAIGDQLKVHHGFVTPTSFVSVLKEQRTPREFHVLKLDMDGLECDLLDALLLAGYVPSVVIIEASPGWPPPFVWQLNTDPTYSHNGCNKGCSAMAGGGQFFYGCSLQSVAAKLRPFGYLLVQYPMEDAWFVHERHLASPCDTSAKLQARSTYDAWIEGNPHAYFRGGSPPEKERPRKETSQLIREIARKECARQKHTKYSPSAFEHLQMLLDVFNASSPYSGIEILSRPSTPFVLGVDRRNFTPCQPYGTHLLNQKHVRREPTTSSSWTKAFFG